MIKVNIEYLNNNLYKLEVVGHALDKKESNSKYDLVCSGVSMLITTIMGSIENKIGAESLTYSVQSGHTTLEVLEKREELKDINLVLRTGLDLVVKSYGLYIEVHIKES